jgi:Cft2 family RNA processing exonuclease
MLMDASHCPGAVMFLFKSIRFGTVLHTGDFRFAESMLSNEVLFPVERKNRQGRGMSIEIDYLYLDNTFADSKFDTPSREEAYGILRDIVKEH